MFTRSVGLLGLVTLFVAAPVVATAQVIGTFSWQTQPYCNAITVTVIQQGALYQLTGTDNLCGAGTAPVTGTAVPVGSNVVFGITAALPTGRAAHLSATISLATLSGTWSDADGNTGGFAFGASAAGAARPTPASASAITVNQFAPTVYAGPGVATTVARSDHDHDARYYTQAQVDARQPEVVFSAFLSPPTIDLTGNPRSVTTTRPGRLDVRMAFSFNITCGTGNPVYFLTVDGVVLRDSFVSTSAGPYQGYLIGVTPAVVAAGTHTIGYAVDCPTGPAGGSIGFPSGAAVIVLP